MPLTGIRVLDLTRLLPGAYCTQLLADMGADVIKIEEPGGGDYMRWTPPLVDGQSALFNALNRNKRSVTINLKAGPGRDILLSLVDAADVLVEGNRPGVMDRLLLGWDVLHARNRRLVMCSITGYGQDGPYASRAGHDLNYMAIAGALGLNGQGTGATRADRAAVFGRLDCSGRRGGDIQIPHARSMAGEALGPGCVLRTGARPG